MPNNERGNLEIPANATVLWGEPAITVETLGKSYLFPNLPMRPMGEYVETGDGDNEHTCYKTQFKEELHQLRVRKSKDNKIKQGTEVLARRIDNPRGVGLNPYAFQVFLFKGSNENNDPSRREMGRGIKVTNKGFLFNESINTKNLHEYFRTIDNDIFSNGDKLCLPDISNINQTVLGDCFMLSAVTAILAAEGGLNYFKNSMRQEDDSPTTVVRLYDPDTKNPVYLRVENTYFCENNDDTVAHTSPWIHLLEKAYAGLGYKYNIDDKKLKYSSSSFRDIYGNGGNTEDAFLILTGQEAKTVYLHNKNQANILPWCDESICCARNLSDKVNLLDEQKLNEAYEAQLKLLGEVSPELRENVESCFENASNFYEWGCYLNKMGELNEELKIQFSKLSLKLNEKHDVLTQLEALKLPKLLEDFGAPEKFVELFRKFIMNPIYDEKSDHLFCHLSSVVEEGLYTKKQLTLFKEIENFLQEDHLLVASTLSKFKGEVPGLRARHSYALLDAKIRRVGEAPHYMFKLRNPWGDTGRVYDWTKKNEYNVVREEKTAGEFWLDLNDFTRYFNDYTVAGPIDGLKLADTFVQNVHRPK